MIVFTVGALFFLPITDGITAVKTDTKIDRLPSVTGAGETTDNLTLTNEVYNDDTSDLTLDSSDGDDTPTLTAYAPGNHTIAISGLSENTTRTITVTYDIAALTIWSGVDTLLGYFPMIWYILAIAMAPAALIAIWKFRRAD